MKIIGKRDIEKYMARHANAATQSDMLVVWNPGPAWTTEGTELYGGLESGAWRHFMSVEPSIVPYTLIPGETRIFTARMRAWGGGGK